MSRLARSGIFCGGKAGHFEKSTQRISRFAMLELGENAWCESEKLWGGGGYVVTPVQI